MTAHLWVPALEPTPNLPATLSSAILTDVLRGELGFRGLIVTDAMEMAGITAAFSPEDAALKALLAGADMVLLPPEPSHVAAFLAAAVRDGRLPASRVEASVRRILEAKAALGLHRRRLVRIDALAREMGKPEFQAQALRTFERSVTLVKNEGRPLPLAPDPVGKTVVLSLSSDKGDYYAGRSFVEEMRARDPDLQVFYADGDTGAEALKAASAACSGAARVVVALFSRLTSGKGSVDLEPGHVDLVRGLAAPEGGPAVVAVSFGSPYFLTRIPEVDAYVCVYRNTPETQRVAVRALFGEIDVEGRLPVSLPGLFPAGHGLVLRAR